MGPQRQKGDALKEYVGALLVISSICTHVFQSVDLTEMAKNGKLDPTIGRDEGMDPFVDVALLSLTSTL